MIPKDIDQITEADLKELIENSVAERKTIEYKKELPGKKDTDKKEFLADVSSFANASGGDIIYGIDEENSVPTEVVGLDNSNIGEDIRRLESIIRDGIEPRIVGVETKKVELDSGRVALVIRTSNSWQSPHRVTYKGHDKFYGRAANGKYPLDVGELRVAFNLSETVAERIRDFRADRIAKILADEGPISMEGKPNILLHVLPLVSFSDVQTYEIKKYYEINRKVRMLRDHMEERRYNFEGILFYCKPGERNCYSYVQIFRNGIIEAVESSFKFEETKLIKSWYEKGIKEALENYLVILKDLAVEPPIFITLTLNGVKDCTMDFKNRELWFMPEEFCSIDRDILIVPERIIENYDVNVAHLLRPCFDSIWNSCGYEKSRNYDDSGNWVGG